MWGVWNTRAGMLRWMVARMVGAPRVLRVPEILSTLGKEKICPADLTYIHFRAGWAGV